MYGKKIHCEFFSAKTQKCIKTNQRCIMHHCFDYFIHYLEIYRNQLGDRVMTVVPHVSVRGRHPYTLERQSRCAEVRQNSGVSVAFR